MANSPHHVQPATNLRDRKRNRIRAPFGDEDIPIVFAGAGAHEVFNRRLGASRRTAFVYDDRTLLHKNEWYTLYPECPMRQNAIIQRCDDYGILSRCLLITPEPVSDEVLQYVHYNSYISKIARTEEMCDNDRKEFAKTMDSVYFNQHSALAARLAVGSLIQALELVHRGDVRNAFCLTRPPGHHAMEDEACGFSLFNNVAVAAYYALDKLDYNRVLILDWDVHHGQGTQYSFYNSSQVLYISIHRYENQQFWPHLRESNFDFVGAGRGRGFNINIPLNENKLTDADYLAIFHRLILPIAFEFDPDLILVSAGYDCAYGCPLGQMEVSPPLFAHLTHKLMCLAEGKLVMALEGGYYADSLAESVAHTISALLGDPMPSLEPIAEIKPSVLKSISDCVSVLRSRWRCLQVFHPTNEPINNQDTIDLPERTWKSTTHLPESPLVKVPTIEPETHVHTPADQERIDQWMSHLKSAHSAVHHTPGSVTCLVYDSRMENHRNENDRTHPECPNRIRRAYELLDERGLARRCKRIEARFASRLELLRVHTPDYVDRMAATAQLPQSSLNEMDDEIDSIYFNKHTYDCARLAAGSVMAVVDEVCSGQSLNGVALVRPPGHHALPNRSMGFCFFNNVAVGARHAQEVYGLTKIAIVDWDVHHGNGTAKIFENDPNVLYISVHRYDEGRFFPSVAAASPSACGVDDGVGHTVQVGWNGRNARDGEYIAVFTHLILPILYEFRPQLVLVSAGYDAVRGDRLGGLGVSVECFAHLTHLLLSVAYLNSSTPSEQSSPPPQRVTRQRSSQTPTPVSQGGLILVLEGGYNLSATAEALCHSVASLLGDACPRLSFGVAPSEKGAKAIRKALHIQRRHWKSLNGHGPSELENHHDNLSLHRPHSAPLSAFAFTGQLEALLQSRLEDLSLSDGPTRGFNSPAQQIISPPSASISMTVPDTLALETASTSFPTRALESHVPVTADQVAETLQDLGTDVLTSHQSAQAASTSVIPSSSVIESPTQLVDQISRLNINEPLSARSSRSTISSELNTTPQQGYSQEGSANSSTANLRSPTAGSSRTGNEVVAVSTLQDLLDFTGAGTEDIHGFFGLDSTHQLPEQLFAVVPLTWCPHLSAVRNNPEWSPNMREVCQHCDHRAENWVCLTCYAVFCGRYANSHMLSHFTASKHPLVLSFADLSSWCYECEAYVHNEALSDVKRVAHRAKFGVDIPSVRD